MLDIALLALTMNVFMESQGEPLEGMRATADTVITRVDSRHYPNNVYDVVMQRKQFSWVAANKVRNKKDLVAFNKRVKAKAYKNPKARAAYINAEKVAKKALEKGYKPKNRFTHFHATRVKPRWAKGKRGVRIGRHIYYRNI